MSSQERKKQEAVKRLKELKEAGEIAEGMTVYCFFMGQSINGIGRFKVYLFNAYPVCITSILADFTNSTYWSKSGTVSLADMRQAVRKMSHELFDNAAALRAEWIKL